MNRPTEAIKQHRARAKQQKTPRLLDLDQALSASIASHPSELPETLYVSPGQIEDSGYAVVSQNYLARLEMVAHSSFAFLGGEIDYDTLQEELTSG